MKLKETEAVRYTGSGNGRPRAAAGQANSAGGSVEQGAVLKGEFLRRLVTSAEDHSAECVCGRDVREGVTGHQVSVNE